MQRRLLFLQAIVLVVIAVLDIYFGLEQRYFWTISWWDIPLHILGGLWVGLFGAWALLILNIRVSVMQCIMAALLIGGAWELFEYAAGLGGSVFMSYRLDTAKDLFDDMVGGAIAGYIAKKLI